MQASFPHHYPQSFPSWSFEIGDPTFAGWFTVFAYFLTSVISFIVFLRSKKIFSIQDEKKQKYFWLIFSIVFLFLGINKQLDLQSYLTEIAKYYARKDGWYAFRRAYQKQFIIFIASALSFSLFLLVYFFNKIIYENILAILGLFLLFAFIAIRASSFHHMDSFISYEIFNLKLNWLFELGGIFLVFISAKSYVKFKFK